MAPLYQSLTSSSDHLKTNDAASEASKLIIDVENGFLNHVQTDLDSSSSCIEYIGSQMKKRPILILSTMLLLACTVGHTLTVLYYWDSINRHDSPVNAAAITSVSESSTSLLDDREMTEKSKKRKAQQYADEQKKLGLNDPSLVSQLYYDKTQNDDESSTGKNGSHTLPIMAASNPNNPPPPLPPPEGCQSTIMLIRHCEKGGVREHCNAMGFERANYIATLFGNDNERWPAPSKLYALSPGSRNKDYVENWREVETIKPLSTKINIPIDDKYSLNDLDNFANEIFAYLRSGEACGKTTVISWKHDDLPAMANLFGCGPQQGCPLDFDPMDFDSVWEIRYTYKKQRYSPYPAAEDKKKKQKTWGLHPEWFIFGKVEKENFDPLAFSKQQGAYN